MKTSTHIKIAAMTLFLTALLLGAVSCASTQKNITQDEAAAAPQQAGQTKPANQPSDESASGASLIGAIEQSAEKIAAALRKGSRVAIVAFESESDNLSDFIMEEFTGALVDRSIEVADRQNLEYLETELKFQMSGAVSDDDVKRVGQFLAADMVVTGQLLNVGKTYRYRTNAIHLEEATRTAVTRLDVPNDAEMQSMVAALAGQRTSVKTARYGAERKTPGANLDCGILFLNRKNYEMAINCFTQTIMQNPDMAVAYFYRGRVYAATRDNDGAFKDYSEAIRLNPNLAEAYNARGDVYYAASRGNVKEAIREYTEAIRINPSYVEAYRSRGYMYLIYGNNRNPDSAIADFTRAIQLEPKYADTYYQRALSYRLKEDFGKAAADYEQAIRLAPDSVDYYAGRADMYRDRGDLAKAMPDHDQVIRLNSRDHIRIIVENLWSIGKQLIKKGDFNKAIAYYTEVIRVRPNDISGLTARGQVYFERGIFDKAIADFTEAIRVSPNSYYAYHYRGDVYFKMDDMDKAIADYEKGDWRDRDVQITMNYARAYHRRANAYLKKGDTNKAIAAYDKAMEIKRGVIYPSIDKCALYLDRGNAYFIIKDFDKALKDYEEIWKSFVLNRHYNEETALGLKPCIAEAMPKFEKLKSERGKYSPTD